MQQPAGYTVYNICTEFLSEASICSRHIVCILTSCQSPQCRPSEAWLCAELSSAVTLHFVTPDRTSPLMFPDTAKLLPFKHVLTVLGNSGRASRALIGGEMTACPCVVELYQDVHLAGNRLSAERGLDRLPLSSDQVIKGTLNHILILQK